MRVKIRRKNLIITPALQIYIDTKILKPVKRLLKSESEKELPILDLEFYRRTGHHRKGDVYHAEANLSLGGKMIRAKVDDVDMRSAIDLLEEELARQIITTKSRRQTLYKRGARRAKKDLRFDKSARFYRRGRILDEGV